MTIKSGTYRLDIADTVAETWGKKLQQGLQGNSGADVSNIFDLSVVIPTRNERDNIGPLLKSLQNALHDLYVEVIFVDDSDDDTSEVIQDAKRALDSSLLCIQLEHRLAGEARAGGLATAVVYGMSMAQAGYIAVIDADLQHPPALLRQLYEQAVMQDVDLVLASRYIQGGSNQGLASGGRRLISVGMKWMAKLLFPEQLWRISDPLSGFFLLRRSLLTNVSLRPIGYKILLEILLRCQWRDVLEVPYCFNARIHGQSKANLRQGTLALLHMQRLWREVPAAGRIWKIGMLLLFNGLVALALILTNKAFATLWPNLNVIAFVMVACLDFVLLNRAIFPDRITAGKEELELSTLVSLEDTNELEDMALQDVIKNGHHLYVAKES